MGKKKAKKKKPEPIVLVLSDEQQTALRDAVQRLGEGHINSSRERLAKFFTQRFQENVTSDYQNEHTEALQRLIFGEMLCSEFDDDLRYVFGEDIITLRTPEQQAEIDAKKSKGKGKKGVKAKAKKNVISTADEDDRTAEEMIGG